MSLFEEEAESTVITELKNLDLYNMTPMEVMMAVAELKRNYKEDPRDGEDLFLVVSNALIDFLDLFL